MFGLRSRWENAKASTSSSVSSSPRSSIGSDADEVKDTKPPDKYLLRVQAGPNYDVSTHKVVHVNGEDPLLIENEFMSVRLKVRIQGFKGLPRACQQSSPYFSHALHKSDQYSIAFSFIPKVDIPAVDTIWGNDFNEPIRDRLPPGFNTAFRIVKNWIDPGLEVDAYADEPWLYGPALGCWFAFRIGDMPDQPKDQEVADIAQQNMDHAVPEDQDIIEEGADGSGKEVRAASGMPDAADKRRKWALDDTNREKLVFEKGRIYHVDFHNPYLDFSNCALKLPGFSLGVLRYIGDKTHTLRYVFKNKSTGDAYFVVELKLLYGQDLNDAVEMDRNDRDSNDQDSNDRSPLKETTNAADLD